MVALKWSSSKPCQKTLKPEFYRKSRITWRRMARRSGCYPNSAAGEWPTAPCRRERPRLPSIIRRLRNCGISFPGKARFGGNWERKRRWSRCMKAFAYPYRWAQPFSFGTAGRKTCALSLPPCRPGPARRRRQPRPANGNETYASKPLNSNLTKKEKCDES